MWVYLLVLLLTITTVPVGNAQQVTDILQWDQSVYVGAWDSTPTILGPDGVNVLVNGPHNRTLENRSTFLEFRTDWHTRHATTQESVWRFSVNNNTANVPMCEFTSSVGANQPIGATAIQQSNAGMICTILVILEDNTSYNFKLDQVSGSPTYPATLGEISVTLHHQDYAHVIDTGVAEAIEAMTFTLILVALFVLLWLGAKWGNGLMVAGAIVGFLGHLLTLEYGFTLGLVIALVGASIPAVRNAWRNMRSDAGGPTRR